MTAAGLDPSRIQERATILAKAHGAKRKRMADEDVDMEGEDGEDEEGDWMDVDGEDSPNKRAKGNAGGIVPHRRAPKTNRQLAGMRDEGVSTLQRRSNLLGLITSSSIIASIKSCQVA